MRFPYRGAGIFLVYKNSVLMGKRSKHPFIGFWSIPGGGRERSLYEEDIDTAVREVFEETGIKIEKKELNELNKWVLEFPFFKWTTYFLKITTKPKILKPSEFSKLDFIQFDELHKYLKRPFSYKEIKLAKKYIK